MSDMKLMPIVHLVFYIFTNNVPVKVYREHRKNWHGKNNTPKIYFGSIISEREKTPKRIGTDSLSWDNAQEPTLPTRTRWQIREMGWSTQRHPKRKTENSAKQKAYQNRDGRRRRRQWRNTGRCRKDVWHIGERWTVCSDTNRPRKRCHTNTHWWRNAAPGWELSK